MECDGLTQKDAPEVIHCTCSSAASTAELEAIGDTGSSEIV